MKVKEHGQFKAGDLVRFPTPEEAGCTPLTPRELHGARCRLIYYETGYGCWRVNFRGKGNTRVIAALGLAIASESRLILVERRNP